MAERRQQTALSGWQFDLRSVGASLPPATGMMVRGGSQSPLSVPRRKNELSHEIAKATSAASAARPTASLVIDRLHLGNVRRLVAVVEGVDLRLVRRLLLRRRRPALDGRLVLAQHAQRQRRAVAGL